MIILKSLDTLEFKFKHSFHKLGLYNLIDNSGSIHNSKLFQQYRINIQSVIFHLLLTPPPDISCGSNVFATRKKGENCSGVITKSRCGKSILQVPDTGTRVLANTGPFFHSSIVSF